MIIKKIAYKTARHIGKSLDDPSRIADILSKKKNKEVTLTHDDCIDVFAYTLQAIYGELFKIGIVLSISAILGFFLEALLVTLAFSILRNFAGGVHMKTFERCLVATSVLILSFGYMASVIKINTTLTFGIMVLLTILTYILTPVGSEEKPITCEKYKHSLKIKSLKVVSIFSIIALVFTIIGYSSLGIALLLGIGLELFTLTNFCFKVFGSIEDRLDNIKDKRAC